MEKMMLVLALFVFSCGGEPPAEPAVCVHDVECAEYPTWQTEYTFREEYSNYVCEPCWYSERYDQRGECCACNPETHHHWCDSDGTGMYHCSPMGHLEHFSCASYCQSILGHDGWFTNDDVCFDAYPDDGEATCSCGE